MKLAPIYTSRNPDLWQRVHTAFAEVLGPDLLDSLDLPIMQINSGIDEPPTDAQAEGSNQGLFRSKLDDLFRIYHKCFGCFPAYAYLDVEPVEYAQDVGGPSPVVAERQVIRTKGEFLTCKQAWPASLITLTGRRMAGCRIVRDSLGATTKFGIWSLAKHRGHGFVDGDQFENADRVWAASGVEWYPVNANPRKAGTRWEYLTSNLHTYKWSQFAPFAIPCTQLDLGSFGNMGDLPEDEVEEMLTAMGTAFGTVAIWFQTDDEATTDYAVSLIRRYADSIRRAVRNVA